MVLLPQQREFCWTVIGAAPGLRDQAREWVAKYPQVYRMFERYALQMAQRGRRFGMRLLVERVRWEYRFTYDEEFKINNNLTPYLARWLTREHPELAGLLEFRCTRDERRRGNVDLT